MYDGYVCVAVCLIAFHILTLYDNWAIRAIALSHMLCTQHTRAHTVTIERLVKVSVPERVRFAQSAAVNQKTVHHSWPQSAHVKRDSMSSGSHCTATNNE